MSALHHGQSNRVCVYVALPKTRDIISGLEARIGAFRAGLSPVILAPVLTPPSPSVLSPPTGELQSALDSQSRDSPTPPAVASSGRSSTSGPLPPIKTPSVDPYLPRQNGRSSDPIEDQQSFSQLVQDLFGLEAQPPLPTLDSAGRTAHAPGSKRASAPSLPPAESTGLTFTASEYPSEFWPSSLDEPSFAQPPPSSGPSVAASSFSTPAGLARSTTGLPLPAVSGWGDGTQIPRPLRDHLLRNFFARRHQFGLFLDLPRFFGSVTSGGLASCHQHS